VLLFNKPTEQPAIKLDSHDGQEPISNTYVRGNGSCVCWLFLNLFDVTTRTLMELMDRCTIVVCDMIVFAVFDTATGTFMYHIMAVTSFLGGVPKGLGGGVGGE